MNGGFMNRILLAVLALAVAAVMIFSPRSWSMLDEPQVVLLAPLARSVAVEQILNENDSRAVLPYPHGPGQTGGAPTELIAAGRSIGFAHREVSLLKMAFWSYADPGFVAVEPAADGYAIEPLTLDQVKRIDAVTGGHAADHRFPFWRNLWGWLFVVGFIAWFVVQRRVEAAAEREAESLEAEGATA
jgi:hypothetical protein